MNITSKEEALELANLRIEEDAVFYIRQIESALMVWRPGKNIPISIPEREIAMYVASLYRNLGWNAEVDYVSSSVPSAARFRLDIS